MRTWRLLCDDEGSPTWNMAVDEAIMDAAAEKLVPPTLRLYRWERLCVSAGRFQGVDKTVNLEACRQLRIPIVRRPTGGRGILHGGDQTISITVPIGLLGSAGRSVIETYRFLSRGFITALTRLDRELSLGKCKRPTGQSGDCFAVRSQADLVTSEGVKVVGSAQCRRGGVVLQQSSLRHLPNGVESAQVFLGPASGEDYPLQDVGEEDLRQALLEGFEVALDMSLQPSSLTAWEIERAGVLMGKYAPLNAG
jgi:lipoate-protein ligase A